MSGRQSGRLVYLASAQSDLRRLKVFLVSAGVTENRAGEIVRGIVERLRILQDNSRIGFSIGGKYGFETPYRGLVCGKYIAIYEPIDTKDGGRIEIRRIYHGREDYLSQLMPERSI
jgi:plasmid stabilization system protein ParE